ncbi:MAG: phosphomannomutase/phosphoglucomutase [Pseudomonadota bacterium]
MLKRKKKKVEDDAKQKTESASPQGISSQGNALRSSVLLALLLSLLPLLGGFGYLVLVREPEARSTQLDRVSQSWADQQASSINYLIADLDTRVKGAAESPMVRQAMSSGSEKTLELVESAMLDYFPDAISLRLLPIDDMGTAGLAGGTQGLRNHIEVDLARRTAEGLEEPKPVAYQFEDQWLTSLSELVIDPRNSRDKAVLITTISNDLLSTRMRALDAGAGRFLLEQIYTSRGRDHIDLIAASGSGDVEEFRRYASVPGTGWRVSFTPSQQLLSDLNVSMTPVYATLVLCVLALLLGAIALLLFFPRRLNQDLEKVISAADKKTPLVLQIPELVTIAKQLRRATLRNLRQGAAPPPAPAIPQPVVETSMTKRDELTNPMFQSHNMLDEDEEVMELDLPESAQADTQDEGIDGFPHHIFRAYDIRGDASSELNEAMVKRIGGAIAAMARDLDEQALIIGCDGRKSSPRIKANLIKTLMECGRDVIDIGMVPTPLLYFATRHLDCKSGVMVTGSHNPADDNGIKLVLQGRTIAAGGIQKIKELAISGAFQKGAGRMIRESITEDYVDEVVNDIAIAIPLKVVVDAGNGATSEVAPQLFTEMGCEVVPLYCEVDGNFPNHPPDTSNEANLLDLAERVQEEGADFGVAFDGDGDRLAVVTGSGRVIRSDLLMMIFARDVVARNPGADVVFDVKCSRHLGQIISQYGGRPVLWKTGHAFMKEKMLETGALLGGEFSGHIFFGERWYGFDDGMYAAGRLAEILSTVGQSLDETIAEFPETVNTPEILIDVGEGEKFDLMSRIVKVMDFQRGKVNTLDGVRVDFSEGWGLLRASNTSPALTARFEADTGEHLAAIQQEFREQIAMAAPDLNLPF